MLKWVFGHNKKKGGSSSALDYEEAKKTAASGNAEKRRDLASSEDLQPEFLYYFATDKSPEVRRAVAQNTGTPLQADVILAKDTDDDVRYALAGKIASLLPDLSPEENEKAADMVHEVLEILARDQLPKVRALIAEEIKSLDNIPKPIVLLLAKDVEEEVASPILECSSLLGDKDLVELVLGGVKGINLAAVAKRPNLGEAVSNAVAETGDEGAVSQLLANQSAEIGPRGFDAIARLAKDVQSWHAPLAGRKGLPKTTILKVVEFFGASLLKQLSERNKLDEETENALDAAIKKRVEEEGEELDQDVEADEVARARAKELIENGEMNADILTDSLNDGDIRFVTHALALLSELPPAIIKKVFNMQSAKSVVALAWKCGFDMGMALSLQQRAANIEPKSMIHPKLDDAFPFTEQNMEWQLELLTG